MATKRFKIKILMHAIMPLTPFAYKMCVKLKKKASNAFHSPRHVGTLMKKMSLYWCRHPKTFIVKGKNMSAGN